MKKIKSVFMRNYEGDGMVYDEVVHGCEWVLNGEGLPTRKFDGACCLVEAERLFRRYDAKHGKTPPETFIPAQAEPDVVTGHWPGWIPVFSDNKADKWFVQAWNLYGKDLRNGTYELCGVHFQGNPEKIKDGDIFIRHGDVLLNDMSRTFEGIRDYLKSNYIEGIVFHRENGDMAKIKRTDFGFEWGGKTHKR